jgi:hypothetical protein
MKVFCGHGIYLQKREGMQEGGFFVRKKKTRFRKEPLLWYVMHTHRHGVDISGAEQVHAG